MCLQLCCTHSGAAGYAIVQLKCTAELTPIPGLLELLSVVDSQSLRKIAVTNAPPKNVELMLDAIGLSDYFEEVVFGEHCARPKPFPDPYQLGLEKIGLTPDCTLVFEDSPAGKFRPQFHVAVRTAVLYLLQPHAQALQGSISVITVTKLT